MCDELRSRRMPAQRIGRLADPEGLPASYEYVPVEVSKGVENLGLMRDQSGLKTEETDPAVLVENYVRHLETHPLDSHIRERLAVLYAGHYQRLDLATDQLDQLIEQPNQPAKQVVAWLNLLADLQVQAGADEELTRTTLKRIIDRYPHDAAALNAQRRLDLLKLEGRRLNQPKSFRLGAYEQNIGLKGRH